MAISTLLVGFGFSATTFHLPFLRHLEAFSLAAVVSSRPQDVKDSEPETQVFPTLEDALDAKQFDLVIITTPNHLHAEQASLALDKGCHVLVEKPFTLSVDDAQALVTLAKEKSRCLNVYHNRRFDDDFLTISALMDSGVLGDIKRIESRFDRFRPKPRDRWRENAGPGSGIFWDLGPHLIDQALQWFGMPLSVTATVLPLREGSESDDFFDVMLRYPTHVVQLGSSPFQAAQTLRFDVQGTLGSFRSFGLDPQENQLREGLPLGDSRWAHRATAAWGELSLETGAEYAELKPGNYLAFFRQLAQTIDSNGELPGPAEAGSIVDVIRIIALAQQSSKQQKTVIVE
ncbi:Gfo/Idh/MocA family oxidoreductase [Alteromonas sp. H39]|uniref:Gfo/Idh/MocA family oxidoreductase n=1 Tax=Alteromonas sp. H39 TaxID=3389876 RepID=UPI0039E1C8E6